MKKKLKKELNRLLPEGLRIIKGRDLEVNKSNILTESIWLRIELERFEQEPIKEQLLEKAKRDYPEGTVFKVVHMPTCERTVLSHDYYEKTFNKVEGLLYINFETTKSDSEDNLAAVYGNGEWAKIIKVPIIKVQDKHLYLGDEFYQVNMFDNFKLVKYIVKDSLNFYRKDNTTEDYNRFLTEQEALDYVLSEAKEMFKGVSKVVFNYDKRYANIEYFKFNKGSGSQLNFNYLSINGIDHIWNDDKGFIAKPIKEELPEWVMVKEYEEFNDSVWHNQFLNVPFKVKSIESEVYEVDFNGEGNYFITKDCAVIPSKAEIAAHKLGFHIGNKVWRIYEPYTYYGVIDSFSYCSSYRNLKAKCDLTGPHSLDISVLTETQPESKLMLGEYKVEILSEPVTHNVPGSKERIMVSSNISLHCNGGRVTEEEWMDKMPLLLKAVKDIRCLQYSSYLEDSNDTYDVTYETNKVYDISVGCIENVTIEQIQAVTDKLNEL